MTAPASAGMAVAALIAKALDKAEDGMIDGALALARGALAGLRRRLAGDGDAEKAISGLLEAPDSDRRVKTLGDLLEARAKSSPALLEELKRIVDEADKAKLRIGPVEQVAEGDGNVQVVSQSSQVNVQTSRRAQH